MEALETMETVTNLGKLGWSFCLSESSLQLHFPLVSTKKDKSIMYISLLFPKCILKRLFFLNGHKSKWNVL